MPNPRDSQSDSPLWRDMWTELRLTLRTAWSIPGASADEAALLRRDQWRAVLNQLALAALSSLLLVAVVAAATTGAAQPLGLAAAALPVVLINGFNLWLWWRERRVSPDTPLNPLPAWLLGLDLFFGGLTDAVLMAYAGHHVQPARLFIVVGTSAALVATAAWMFALLPAAGLGWVVGVLGGILLCQVVAPLPGLDALPGMLLLYGLVLGGAILLNARIFLQGRLAQRQLGRQGEMVELLLRDFETHANDWMLELDGQGQLVRVSPRLTERLALPLQALQGRRLLELLAEYQVPNDPDSAAQLARLARSLELSTAFRDLDVQVSVAGRRASWLLAGHRLDRNDGWRVVGSDVTELREREQELHRLGNIDPVTGLANRHQFKRRLALHLSGGAPADPCTLLLLDLDDFKQINDSHGHSAGDALLHAVGERLRDSLASRRGPGDLVARLGGDEFALLLRGELEASSLQRLAKQLRSALAVPVVIDQHHIDIAASFGGARAPTDASTPEDLLRAADLALYAAKADGRNRLRLFEPSMRDAAIERASLLSELRRALELGQFELHYQPQIDLGLGQLRGFEALLRWRHPERGLISPAVFIPLAEESGLILAVGAWVMNRACRDAANWPEPLSVAINVSAVQFERSPIEAQLQEALLTSGVAPHRVEIELTESALLQDTERGIELLQRLRAHGVRLALDDFGTGFSSLAYLRRLPLDQLKIDRAFVIDLDRPGADSTGRAIVGAIHELARALGLQTVAEGIETEAQHASLRRLGCNMGQGYLFAPAMPARRAQQFIQDTQRLSLASACHRLRLDSSSEPTPATPALSPTLNPRQTGSSLHLPDTRWSPGPGPR